MFESKIFGVAETMQALRKIDPEMAKELTKAMKQPGNLLVKQARSYVNATGLSNWGDFRGGYDAAVIRRKLKAKVLTAKRKGSKGSLLRVINDSAAGSIWEMAGRKTDGKNAQGRAFIQNITDKAGRKANRLIYRAWDESDQAGIQQEVRDAVARAEATVQAYLDRVNSQLAPTGVAITKRSIVKNG